MLRRRRSSPIPRRLDVARGVFEAHEPDDEGEDLESLWRKIFGRKENLIIFLHEL